MTFDVIRDLLRVSPVAQPFRGCTPEEIDQLERHLGLPLPPTYRTFLAFMGHGAGNVLHGSGWQYQDVMEITTWMAEGQGPDLSRVRAPLPEDAFFFFDHQGYDWAFLCTRLGDASPVYGHLDVDEEPREHFREIAPSFLDWLREMVLHEIVAWENFEPSTVPYLSSIYVHEGDVVAGSAAEGVRGVRRRYERMLSMGAGEDAMTRAALAEGLHPLAVLVLIRRLFGLAYEEAREVLTNTVATAAGGTALSPGEVDLALHDWDDLTARWHEYERQLREREEAREQADEQKGGPDGSPS